MRALFDFKNIFQDSSSSSVTQILQESHSDTLCKHAAGRNCPGASPQLLLLVSTTDVVGTTTRTAAGRPSEECASGWVLVASVCSHV